jgi:predicted RNA binding protein YcfA (HicA-like mRNA interferase family)
LAKLKTLSGSDVCRLLAAEGFTEVRRRGSHAVMQKRLPETTVTIPAPLHREIRAGTLLSIIRQSGLPRRLFEAT